MKDDTARVPAWLLCGGTLEDRDAAIARLTEPVAGGHRVAVLRAGSGMFASAAAPLGPHVVVKRAPIGCLCCTAGVMFRVALFELLRASRPARLVIDLGAGTHVATLEAQLHGEALARALRVVGRVDLDAASGPDAVSWSPGP
jgi:predicted RNA methylase